MLKVHGKSTNMSKMLLLSMLLGASTLVDVAAASTCQLYQTFSAKTEVIDIINDFFGNENASIVHENLLKM